jgi:hypothetical protein
VALRASGLDMAWARDLVSADPAPRHAALQAFQRTESRYQNASRLSERLIFGDGNQGDDPASIAVKDQAITELQVAGQYSFLNTVAEWGYFGSPNTTEYAITYLEWETWFPEDWPKNWGVKRHVLQMRGELRHRPTSWSE